MLKHNVSAIFTLFQLHFIETGAQCFNRMHGFGDGVMLVASDFGRDKDA